jgi:SAM-dependent methyltransferase
MANWLTDSDALAAQYASEESLRQRVVAHEDLVEGTDDEQVVRARILEARPSHFLEVGSGLGGLCAWAKANLGGMIVGVDSSQRMVELTARAGATAIRADMRRLPFADRAFDCAVANFVLYHVADSDRALAEVARVLEGDGRLVASTLSNDTESRRLAWATLFNEDPQPAQSPLSFSRENGRRLLLNHFSEVEQVDCDAALVFPTRDRLVPFVESLPPMKGLGEKIPEFTEPFRLPEKTTVFVATSPK